MSDMSETGNEQVQYVGFFIRLVASLIDSVIAMLVLGFVVELLLGPGQSISDMTGATPADAWRMLTNPNTSTQALLTAIVTVVLWIAFAATPGKMLFDAHIVDARTLGRASSGQLVIRYLGYFVNIFCLFLGFIWIIFDPRKQGWHDKMAGTAVVRVGKVGRQKAE